MPAMPEPDIAPESELFMLFILFMLAILQGNSAAATDWPNKANSAIAIKSCLNLFTDT